MTAAAQLLAELNQCGVVVWAEGSRLRFKPRSAVDPGLLERLRTAKGELLDVLKHEGAGLLDRFLADSTLPAAVFHSRALGRDFLFCRGEAALDVLAEADRALPVLFFTEAEKLSQLGLVGLRTLLDCRAEFGPAVRVEQVRPARG